MSHSGEELDITAVLAPVFALGEGVANMGTPLEKEARLKAAEWLAATHSPLEIAALAVAGGCFATEAWKRVKPVLDGQEVPNDLHALELLATAVEHGLQAKIAVYKAAGEARKEVARKGATASLAKSPKQATKAKVKELWESWQAGRARHHSGAAFARHVMATFPELQSQKVIEGWVTAWRKAKAAKAK